MTAITTAAACSGGTIVAPTKSPEAESETPPRIQPSKPISFNNGVLKRHAPPPVVYKECLKNHAASLGGHALDGCGEFMAAPNATPSDPTSLKCAACGCHRNFHRREPEDSSAANNSLTHVIEYHPHHRHHPLPPPSLTAPVPSHGARSPGSQSPPPISSTYYPGSAPHMLLALSGGPDGTTPTTNNGPYHQLSQQNNVMMNSCSSQQAGGSRKRFRTKFSQEQKEKMHEFAEKVGWKMQRTDDSMVNAFCNEIGVERGVFKVWMHNNKNTFGKRSTDNNNNLVDDEDIRNSNENGNDDNINSHLHHHIIHQQHYSNGAPNFNAAPPNASSSSS